MAYFADANEVYLHFPAVPILSGSGTCTPLP